MKSRCLAIGILGLLAVAVAQANTAPEPGGFGFIFPNVSATIGKSVSFDISPHFPDPDGDDLDYFIPSWSDPLPAGLSMDSETGLITGTFEGLGKEIARLTFFYAEDPSGAQSGTGGFVIWVPVSYGPRAGSASPPANNASSRPKPTWPRPRA